MRGRHHYRNCRDYIATGLQCRFCSTGCPRPERSRIKAKEMSRILEQKIYDAAIQLCEGSELVGIIEGNGHHVAQLIATSATNIYLNHEWKRRKP